MVATHFAALPPSHPLFHIVQQQHCTTRCDNHDVYAVLTNPDFVTAVYQGNFCAVTYVRNRIPILVQLALGCMDSLKSHRPSPSAGEIATVSFIALHLLCGKKSSTQRPLPDDTTNESDDVPGGSKTSTTDKKLRSFYFRNVSVPAASVGVSVKCGPIWNAPTARNFFADEIETIRLIERTILDSAHELQGISRRHRPYTPTPHSQRSFREASLASTKTRGAPLHPAPRTTPPVLSSTAAPEQADALSTVPSMSHDALDAPVGVVFPSIVSTPRNVCITKAVQVTSVADAPARDTDPSSFALQSTQGTCAMSVRTSAEANDGVDGSNFMTNSEAERATTSCVKLSAAVVILEALLVSVGMIEGWDTTPKNTTGSPRHPPDIRSLPAYEVVSTALTSFLGIMKSCKSFEASLSKDQMELTCTVQAVLEDMRVSFIALFAYQRRITSLALTIAEEIGQDVAEDVVHLTAEVLTPDLIAVCPNNTEYGKSLELLLQFIFTPVISHQNVIVKSNAPKFSFSLHSQLTERSDLGGEELPTLSVRKRPSGRTEVILRACFSPNMLLLTAIGTIAEMDIYGLGLPVARAMMEHSLHLAQLAVECLQSSCPFLDDLTGNFTNTFDSTGLSYGRTQNPAMDLTTFSTPPRGSGAAASNIPYLHSEDNFSVDTSTVDCAQPQGSDSGLKPVNIHLTLPHFLDPTKNMETRAGASNFFRAFDETLDQTNFTRVSQETGAPRSALGLFSHETADEALQREGGLRAAGPLRATQDGSLGFECSSPSDIMSRNANSPSEGQRANDSHQCLTDCTITRANLRRLAMQWIRCSVISARVLLMSGESDVALPLGRQDNALKAMDTLESLSLSNSLAVGGQMSQGRSVTVMTTESALAPDVYRLGRIPLHQALFEALEVVLNAMSEVLLSPQPRLTSSLVNEITSSLYGIRLGMLERQHSTQLEGFNGGPSSFRLQHLQRKRESWTRNTIRSAQLLESSTSSMSELTNCHSRSTGASGVTVDVEQKQLLTGEEWTALLSDNSLNLKPILQLWISEQASNPNHPSLGFIGPLQALLNADPLGTPEEAVDVVATLRLLLGVTNASAAVPGIAQKTLHIDDLDEKGLELDDSLQKLGSSITTSTFRRERRSSISPPTSPNTRHSVLSPLTSPLKLSKSLSTPQRETTPSRHSTAQASSYVPTREKQQQQHRVSSQSMATSLPLRFELGKRLPLLPFKEEIKKTVIDADDDGGWGGGRRRKAGDARSVNNWSGANFADPLRGVIQSQRPPSLASSVRSGTSSIHSCGRRMGEGSMKSGSVNQQLLRYSQTGSLRSSDDDDDENMNLETVYRPRRGKSVQMDDGRSSPKPLLVPEPDTNVSKEVDNYDVYRGYSDSNDNNNNSNASAGIALDRVTGSGFKPSPYSILEKNSSDEETPLFPVFTSPVDMSEFCSKYESSGHSPNSSALDAGNHSKSKYVEPMQPRRANSSGAVKLPAYSSQNSLQSTNPPCNSNSKTSTYTSSKDDRTSMASSARPILVPTQYVIDVISAGPLPSSPNSDFSKMDGGKYLGIRNTNQDGTESEDNLGGTMRSTAPCSAKSDMHSDEDSDHGGSKRCTGLGESARLSSCSDDDIHHSPHRRPESPGTQPCSPTDQPKEFGSGSSSGQSFGSVSQKLKGRSDGRVPSDSDESHTLANSGLPRHRPPTLAHTGKPKDPSCAAVLGASDNSWSSALCDSANSENPIDFKRRSQRRGGGGSGIHGGVDLAATPADEGKDPSVLSAPERPQQLRSRNMGQHPLSDRMSPPMDGPAHKASDHSVRPSNWSSASSGARSGTPLSSNGSQRRSSPLSNISAVVAQLASNIDDEGPLIPFSPVAYGDAPDSFEVAGTHQDGNSNPRRKYPQRSQVPAHVQAMMNSGSSVGSLELAVNNARAVKSNEKQQMVLSAMSNSSEEFFRSSTPPQSLRAHRLTVQSKESDLSAVSSTRSSEHRHYATFNQPAPTHEALQAQAAISFLLGNDRSPTETSATFAALADHHLTLSTSSDKRRFLRKSSSSEFQT